MRIAAIGCGGFIGSHLLDRLVPRRDVEIEGWDPDVRKIRRHLGASNFVLHQHEATSPARLPQLEDAIRRADVVVNLAAICNPAEYNTRPLQVIHANLFDVYPIVEICARHRTWLIHFSTSEVYGRTISSYLHDPGDDPSLYELVEDGTPLIMGPIHRQRWTYACAKQMVERLIYAHHYEHGLPFTIVRPLNFFGPRMDFIPGVDGAGVPRVLASFMSALMNGTPLTIVDGGRARRTIVSIHEAIDALVLMLERRAAAVNEVFNIGNPANEVTMAQLADLMRCTYAQITGDASYCIHPIEDVSADAFYGPGYEDCDRRMPDVSKARTRLGWQPSRGLRTILRETMASYHEQYAAEIASRRVAVTS